MRTWILIASIVLAGLVFLAWHEVDWAIDTRATHAPMPDELITIGTESADAGDGPMTPVSR